MSILQILAAFILGVVILAFGVVKRKKWVMLVSAIPLLIVAYQIVMLVLMAQH